MKKPLFIPSQFYHIYNHANGRDNLFVEKINYYYFLDKWRFYTNHIMDVVAYCLMPNHFHFLVRIKDEIIIPPPKDLVEDPEKVSRYISQMLSNHFNCYSKSINKKYTRMGSLFNQNFKRKHVENDIYLKILVCYIHNNPDKHGFARNIDEWEFSSIHHYFSEEESWVKKEYVQNLFNSKEEFLSNHELVKFASVMKGFG